MKKSDLASQLARTSDMSEAEAADELDRVTHRILSRLRQGKQVQLPGLGTFHPGPSLQFEFKRKESKKTARRRENERRSRG